MDMIVNGEGQSFRENGIQPDLKACLLRLLWFYLPNFLTVLLVVCTRLLDHSIYFYWCNIKARSPGSSLEIKQKQCLLIRQKWGINISKSRKLIIDFWYVEEPSGHSYCCETLLGIHIWLMDEQWLLTGHYFQPWFDFWTICITYSEEHLS